MDIIKPSIEHILYPYMERKKGNRIRQYTEEMKKSQSLSAAELKKMQEQKLKTLLLYCAENVPAYSYLNRNEIEKDPFEVLHSRVHILTKTLFREDPDSYLASGFPAGKRIVNLTGGSTGIPLRTYLDRVQVEHYEAARWRGLSWHDVSYGSRCLMIWGNPTDLDRAGQKKYAMQERFLKNRRVISAFTLSQDKASEYVDFINSYKPEYLYGYASSLVAFTKIIENYGKEKIKVRFKLICSTSETLFPDQQKHIEDVFGCRVVGEYGAHDGGIMAYGCPHGNLHISAENAILEVLDPVTHQPLAEGEVGTLAVTDLNMRAQPRLRYIIGDLGALTSEPCSCGLGLPVLSKLAGREDDLLVCMDGSLAHGSLIAHFIWSFQQVRQFRFVQHTKETGTLYLAADHDPELAEKTGGCLAQALGGTDIKVEFVDEIKPSASGKMRYAVREFPLS